MDIIQVITTLDTHWTVIHAEILEIEKDLDHCYQFQRRYGSQFWQKSVVSLLKLKSEKESAVSVAIKIGHSFSTPTHISHKSCFNITTTHPSYDQRQLRDIKLQMELFHLHVESGRDLCRKLERTQPMHRASTRDTLNNKMDPNNGAPNTTETFAVWSSILANSEPAQ